VLLGKLVYGDNNQLIAEMLEVIWQVLLYQVYYGLFQNNAGGAWMIMLKSFEAGVLIKW
jgi:K(+)-stimulated pyrophosphate-energized sodium pump